MKRILIFACFASLAVAQTSDDFWRQYTALMREPAANCVKKLGFPDEVVDRFITERYSKDLKTMGALKVCVLTDANLLVNGKIRLDVAYEIIDSVSGQQPKLAKELRKLVFVCLKRTNHFRDLRKRVTELLNCCSAGLDRFVKRI